MLDLGPLKSTSTPSLLLSTGQVQETRQLCYSYSECVLRSVPKIGSPREVLGPPPNAYALVHAEVEQAGEMCFPAVCFQHRDSADKSCATWEHAVEQPWDGSQTAQYIDRCRFPGEADQREFPGNLAQ